jgi:hypothetical protein
MNHPRAKSQSIWWLVVLAPLVAPLLILGAVVFLLYVVATVCLHLTIWTWWCLRGRDILFVYSDSPIWHDYIEQAILPYLGERAVVLNWSHRKRWTVSVARLAFHHFGGYQQFNPMAVVFRPFRRSRRFRFWQPFRDFKHGHPEALYRMEREFFDLVGVQRKVATAIARELTGFVWAIAREVPAPTA